MRLFCCRLARPGEGLCAIATKNKATSRLPHCIRAAAVFNHIDQCGCQRGRILGWDNPTRFAPDDRLRHFSDISDDGRQPGLHRLMRGNAETFGTGWLNIALATLQKAMRIGGKTGKMNIAKAKFGSESLQPSAFAAFARYHYFILIRQIRAFGFYDTHGGDQNIISLVRMEPTERTDAKALSLLTRHGLRRSRIRLEKRPGENVRGSYAETRRRQRRDR